jgi:F0F1-type ATP synthase assembly protein I
MASDPSKNIGKYTSLALLLPISTFVGFAMGYGLDLLFHTVFLRWIFVALGTVSGFISLIRELDKG